MTGNGSEYTPRQRAEVRHREAVRDAKGRTGDEPAMTELRDATAEVRRLVAEERAAKAKPKRRRRA